jgi:hypothetical protein
MLESSQTNPHSDLPPGGISTEIQTAPGDAVQTEPRPLPFGVYRGEAKKPVASPEPK